MQDGRGAERLGLTGEKSLCPEKTVRSEKRVVISHKHPKGMKSSPVANFSGKKGPDALTEVSVRESDRVPPKRLPSQRTSTAIKGYDSIVSELIDLVESARRVSARSVNAVMTATYWEIGRRIVEFEQAGKKRAKYGEELLDKLADGSHREIRSRLQRR